MAQLTRAIVATSLFGVLGLGAVALPTAQEKIDSDAAIRIAERFVGQLRLSFLSGSKVERSKVAVEGLHRYNVHVPHATGYYSVYVDDEGRLAQFSNASAQTQLSERTEPGEKLVGDKVALEKRAIEIARILFPTEELEVFDIGFSSGHTGTKKDSAELRALTEHGNFKILVKVDGYVWLDRTYGIAGNVSSYDGTLLWAHMRQWAPPHDAPRLRLDEEAARAAKKKHFPKMGEQALRRPLKIGYMLPEGRESGRLAWCWNAGQIGFHGIDAETGEYLHQEFDLRR